MGYFEDVMIMLRSKTGHDFYSYKKNTIQRGIERRMSIHGINRDDDYVRFLQVNPLEQEFLFKELLIGVTSFFREPMEWELLKDKVIPELLSERTPNDTIRVWVSGCSTGEEAYSLAIVFKEVMDQLKPCQDFSIQIFATDLDIDAINKAREGLFSTSIEKNMSLERLGLYFIKEDIGYRIVKTIRDMVIFAQQNMVMDPPFTKIDLLTCRNMLIYLTPEIQKKLIPIFHYSLNPGGFLFLGSAEAVVNFTELFKPLDRRSRLYQRCLPLSQEKPIEMATSFTTFHSTAINTLSTENIPLPSSKFSGVDAAGFQGTFSEKVYKKNKLFQKNVIQPLVEKLILQNYSPATVLVDSKGDIHFITGRTGKYLELAVGDIKWNIFSMAREGLNYKLSSGINKVLCQKEAVTLKNTVVLYEGKSQIVNISINLLKEPRALRGMIMIVFTDVFTSDVFEAISTVDRKCASGQYEMELERELLLTRQMWRDVSTEMQISQEEFKSSNEELQVTNEELQSINEELTTTKEEALFSIEELRSTNFELQAKFDELLLVTDNMKNQMDSMQIAAVFLDNALRVRHFTSQMSTIYRLIYSDIGRPITDITSDLIYPQLAEDVREVLRTLTSVEKQVMSFNGCWFNVRMLPFRTLQDKIDGVVITFCLKV